MTDDNQDNHKNDDETDDFVYHDSSNNGHDISVMNQKRKENENDNHHDHHGDSLHENDDFENVGTTMDDSFQNNDHVIDTTNTFETTIRTMEFQNRCLHPHHWHSFRPVHLMFSVLQRPICIFCEEKISAIILPTELQKFQQQDQQKQQPIVRCAACDVYAHRLCSTTRSDLWKRRKCSVNALYMMQNDKLLEEQQLLEELQQQQHNYYATKREQQQQMDNEEPDYDSMLPSNADDNDDTTNDTTNELRVTPISDNGSHHQSFLNVNKALQENVLLAHFSPHKQKKHYNDNKYHNKSSPLSSKEQQEAKLKRQQQQQQQLAKAASAARSDSHTTTTGSNDYHHQPSSSNTTVMEFANGTWKKVKFTLTGHNDNNNNDNNTNIFYDNTDISSSSEFVRTTDTENNDNDSNNIETNASSTNTTSASKLNVAAVAGGIAGGLAGMMVAGPAGAYAGFAAASYLVEGTVVVGVVVAGIATGSITGQHLEQQLLKNRVELLPHRVLTMGEDGSSRKVLLVRPHIQIDSLWENSIMVEAKKSYYDTNTTGISHAITNTLQLVQRLPKLPTPFFFLGNNDTNNYDSNRENDSDIVQTAENEISTSEKVLLLVNRTLNDRTSLPGHVYRYLIAEFDDRVRTRQALLESYNSIAATSPRARRDDTHAVIKHVTATILEVRSEFNASQYITELTASAVEALVFARLYDSVMEEIVQETYQKDQDLLTKILSLSQEKDMFDSIIQNTPNDNIEMNNHTNDNDSTKKQRLLAEYMQCNMSISSQALSCLKILPDSHSAVDKLHFCVRFLELISEQYASQSNHRSSTHTTTEALSADSLLKMVCQHLILHVLLLHLQSEPPQESYKSNNSKTQHQDLQLNHDLNAQIVFLEEFARDEQLLRGREGYALVTLQASLHFLNMSPLEDIKHEIFEHQQSSTTSTTNNVDDEEEEEEGGGVLLVKDHFQNGTKIDTHNNINDEEEEDAVLLMSDHYLGDVNKKTDDYQDTSCNEDEVVLLMDKQYLDSMEPIASNHHSSIEEVDEFNHVENNDDAFQNCDSWEVEEDGQGI